MPENENDQSRDEARKPQRFTPSATQLKQQWLGKQQRWQKLLQRVEQGTAHLRALN